MAENIKDNHMLLTLWAVLFFVIGIILGIIAFGGIAVAVSFFTKVLFLIALICILVSFILIIIERIQAKERKD
jgi:uncharacterized membrane protein YtjA (UPF0391 family)